MRIGELACSLRLIPHEKETIAVPFNQKGGVEIFARHQLPEKIRREDRRSEKEQRKKIELEGHSRGPCVS
jgi:hypothetical protein